MYKFLVCFSVFVASQGPIQAAHHDNNSVEAKKQIIAVSIPSETDTQYYQYLQHIADFATEMDAKTKGLDHFIIVHDKTAKKYFGNYTFTNAQLIELATPSLDLWMRDFPSAMPKLQVNFTYRPQYISKETAVKDKAGFDRFARMVGLPRLTQSDIVIEGGNIVENGKDIAVTTARIFSDNPGVSQSALIKELEKTINRTVVVLPDPMDTTGHSDGLVSFVEENTILIALFDGASDADYYDAMEDAVLKLFPKLNVIPLPCYARKGKTQGFVSAEGSYANSLVTYNAVYLPFFSNQTSNKKALDVFKNSTTKTVVPVMKTANIPVLGGSLRCMTWQIDQDSPTGRRLLQYVKYPHSGATSLGMRIAVIFILLQIATLLSN